MHINTWGGIIDTKLVIHLLCLFHSAGWHKRMTHYNTIPQSLQFSNRSCPTPMHFFCGKLDVQPTLWLMVSSLDLDPTWPEIQTIWCSQQLHHIVLIIRLNQLKNNIILNASSFETDFLEISLTVSNITTYEATCRLQSFISHKFHNYLQFSEYHTT